MAFAMIDDLTGEQHPTTAAHRLTLHLDANPGASMDATEVAGWDVASTDPRELLAQLGEHLCGVATPLGEVDVAVARQKLDDVRERIDALRRIGVMACGPNEIRDADDSACPYDSDGLHHASCGCDGVDPLNPNDQSGAVDESATDAPAVVHASTPPQVSEPELVEGAGESAQNDIPADVPVPTGEAENGRATDATIRIWAQAWGVPCSTTGGLKKWVREAYERVRGGEPDATTWANAGLSAPQTSASPTPSVAEEPPPSDPGPSAGRTAAGPATTETPEPAGRDSEETPAPGPPVVTARAPEVAPVGDGDRSRPEQIELAEELAAGGATPRTIVEKTGVTLDEARAAVRRHR